LLLSFLISNHRNKLPSSTIMHRQFWLLGMRVVVTAPHATTIFLDGSGPKNFVGLM